MKDCTNVTVSTENKDKLQQKVTHSTYAVFVFVSP